MTRTVAYLRVSSSQQADHGTSLAAQRAKVEAYAGLFDLELVEVIVDAGESAGSLARPGVQKALGMLKSGKADALLVVKLDRLTRNVRDLLDLMPLFSTGKRALISMGEQIDTRSASGRMVLTLLTTIGQWERESCGERTAAVKSYQREQGRYLGGAVPFGYALAPCRERLVEVADEQAVIREARALRAAGLSYQAVADTLRERGVQARGPVSMGKVARMLSAPARPVAA